MTHFDLIKRSEQFYLPLIADVNFDAKQYPSRDPWTYSDEKVAFGGYVFNINVYFEHYKAEHESYYWGIFSVECWIDRPKSEYDKLMNGGPSRREMYQILQGDAICLCREWGLEPEEKDLQWGDWYGRVEGAPVSFEDALNSSQGKKR